jgi:hypothetical protein
VGGEWREPEDIIADLTSGDPERTRIGLADLREYNKPGDEFDLPAIEPWLLRLLGEPPPEDTVIFLCRLLGSYRSFVPQPSRSHVVRQMIELAVRYAVSQVIFEAALEVKIQADPGAAARDAVGYLRARGLATPREVEAAETLIYYLLEGKQVVRRAATEALAGWPPTEVKQAIVAAVLPAGRSRSAAAVDRRRAWSRRHAAGHDVPGRDGEPRGALHHRRRAEFGPLLRLDPGHQPADRLLGVLRDRPGRVRALPRRPRPRPRVRDPLPAPL